tara:strand:- start:178 stop:567 length:390 start_codon:yes stop_codon:yes gene_type:complete
MAQHFFIKKNSELPILQMKVINDGRNDYKKIFENLENAAITFSMKNVDNGRFKVFNKPGLIIPVEDEACGDVEYYIGYKFSKTETNTAGCYQGEFKIDFLEDGCTIILPIYEDLYINVGDSFVNSRIVC